MLAARAYPEERALRLEQVEQPDLTPGEALVKVEAAGISPVLLAMWQMGRLPRLPMTLGHEIAGTVRELRALDAGLEPGARVRVHPNLTCRRCTCCLSEREAMCQACSMIGSGVFGPKAMPLYQRYHNGGLAEYVRVPVWSLDPLPDQISFAVGAKVHDIANGVRALKLAELPPGATLVITAATGAMGTATIRLAPLFGVSRVIAVGRAPDRLAAVSQLVDIPVETVALDALGEGWEQEGRLTKAIRELSPAGADAVIDYLPEGVGTTQAVAAMRTGGTAVVMGGNPAPVTLPSVFLMVNCWRIVGTRNCSRVDALLVIDLIREGRLAADDVITHRYALSDVNTALDTLKERTDRTWMIVVEPPASRDDASRSEPASVPVADRL